MNILTQAMKETLRAKAQLWISYALIAAVIVLAGVTTYNYGARMKLAADVARMDSQLERAKERVELVEQVNQQQAEAIETIRSLNTMNDTMLKGLATDMEALRVRDRTTFSRLAALEKSNEAVRTYLNTVVPAPVGCLLDRTCPDTNGGGVPATERGTSGAVQPARAGAKPDQR